MDCGESGCCACDPSYGASGVSLYRLDPHTHLPESNAIGADYNPGRASEDVGPSFELVLKHQGGHLAQLWPGLYKEGTVSVGLALKGDSLSLVSDFWRFRFLS